jgi:signal transduction histidine kinase
MTTEAAAARRGAQVRRLLTGAVVLGALVLVAMTALTLLTVADYQDTTRWVNHTYHVKDLVGGLRVALSRTESARRGYLLTGDSYYIQAYRQEADNLPALARTFQAQTADNPRQQANIRQVQALLQSKLNDQDAMLRLLQSGRAVHVDAAEVVRENQGTLNQLRTLLIAMTAEEDRLLSARIARQTREATLLAAAVVASGVVLALLAFSSFLLMRRYAADLDRSQAALRDLNVGLEDEVRRRTADLTRANDEIQRFAYIVSHDLRSPLVNVMGFTSELETAAKALRLQVERLDREAPELLSPAAREAVELDLPESIGFIRASTQKMDRLINAILRLSREGRRSLTPERVDMNALTDGVIASLKTQTDDRGATLEREGDLPDLVSDRLAVEQVLSNVTENALKYLKPGRPGRIRLRGRIVGGERCYEVEDNGRGIDPKDHERVFELFRRAGIQDQPGEGIGLAHVKALVYRLGGTITVASALDQGATFRICLPPSLPRAQETA